MDLDLKAQYDKEFEDNLREILNKLLENNKEYKEISQEKILLIDKLSEKYGKEFELSLSKLLGLISKKNLIESKVIHLKCLLESKELTEIVTNVVNEYENGSNLY